MNKVVKKLLIGLGVVLLGLAAFAAAWVYLIFPRLIADKDEFASKAAVDPADVAKESPIIDFNEEDGILYVNNEVVVIAKADAAPSDVEALADRQGASIDLSMSDIGIYKFTYADAMPYEDLENIVKKLQRSELVEKAYLNVVSIFESDTEEASDFEYGPPVYPDDEWAGDDWDTSAPRGENWGMEAIDAPGAWAYLDQMSTVRVGLIDTMPNTAHPDLVQMFSNTSCIFVDTETGETSTNKYILSPEDHGTHVSGIMNAEWNNGIGVSGVMGGKGALYFSAVYYDTEGRIKNRYGTAYSYLLALKTLIDQDVQVINISQNTNRLIGFAASHGNQNAIDYLTQQATLTETGLSRIISAREASEKKDFVICVAAGNSNSTYYYKDEDEPYGYREEMTESERLKYVSGWRGERGDSLALYNNFLNLMSNEAVKARVIVVGAIGIEQEASTGTNTRYRYTDYSNVGSRVDLVAPGGIPHEAEIYSCYSSGYNGMCGTSMATPHVAGVAGLVFACNPDLSGPDVKNILLASTTGRYYYSGGYSGMINANTAVVNALQTREKSVAKVLKTAQDDGLDLCFVVDTTASMGDDIDNAKENMTEILAHLSEKTSDYRVALIDYRDFPSRTWSSYDYPYQVQLEFTDDDASIQSAINRLDLGDGGDLRETVYSGLMATVQLDWRPEAKKVVIILGDAAPLDPEPETGYVYDDVLRALVNAEIGLDYDDSDKRVVDAFDSSMINVYSIVPNASSDAADFFQEISNQTGGSYAGVANASDVSDAIIDSIEQIEIVQTVAVNADFGDSLSEKNIEIYRGNDYLFTVKTDEDGSICMDAMEPDLYHWKCPEAFVGGSIDIEDNEREAFVSTTQHYWFTPLLSAWAKHKASIILFAVLIILFFLFVPLSFAKMIRSAADRKQKRSAANKSVCCPNCGAQLPPNAKFCGKCGGKLS